MFSLANDKMIATNKGQYIAQVSDWRDDRLSSDKEKNRRCKPQLVSRHSTGSNETWLTPLASGRAISPYQTLNNE